MTKRVTKNILKQPDFQRILIEDQKTYYMLGEHRAVLPFHVQLQPSRMLTRWLNHHCTGYYHVICHKRGCVLFECVTDAYQARMAHGLK